MKAGPTLITKGWETSQLTHYHTMPHPDALKIYSYGKHCVKMRNCLSQAISHFLAMFPTFLLYETLIFHF